MDSENTLKTSLKSEIGDHLLFTPDDNENCSLPGCSSATNNRFVSLVPLMAVKEEPEEEYSNYAFMEVKTEPEELYEYEKGNVDKYSLKFTSALNENGLQNNNEASREKEEFTCSYCEQLFSIQQELTDHMKIHINIEIKCKEEMSFAEWCFKEEGNSVSYQEIHQLVNESRDFTTSSLPTFHKRPDDSADFEENNRDKKPAQCTDCGKIICKCYRLKVHKRNHIVVKPFICHVCPKKFFSYSNLQFHLKAHTGEPPAVCNVCSKRFYHDLDLKKHMRTHTGERPYVCVECNQSFSHNSSWKNHIRKHTGLKPYVCIECNKSFAQNSNLKTHVRTHTGERPFECKDCGK